MASAPSCWRLHPSRLERRLTKSPARRTIAAQERRAVESDVIPRTAWSLWLDVLCAKVLVWVARFGRQADLTPEAHLYFADRYRRLAEYYRSRGRAMRAKQLLMRAVEHLKASGDEDPPFAAAMAMPRPRQWLRTDAVSRARLDSPDDAA